VFLLLSLLRLKKLIVFSMQFLTVMYVSIPAARGMYTMYSGMVVLSSYL